MHPIDAAHELAPPSVDAETLSEAIGKRLVRCPVDRSHASRCAINSSGREAGPISGSAESSAWWMRVRAFA